MSKITMSELTGHGLTIDEAVRYGVISGKEADEMREEMREAEVERYAMQEAEADRAEEQYDRASARMMENIANGYSDGIDTDEL